MAGAEQRLARALAPLLLAGPWEQAGLVRTLRRSLGTRGRWVEPVVATLLERFPTAPTDRPRELAEAIQQHEAYRRAVERAGRRGRPLHLVRAAVSRTAMGYTPWPVRALGDLDVLADWLELPLPRLLWLADPDARRRRTGPGPLDTYRPRWLPRAGGPPRLLEAPTPALKRVQRRLLAEVLQVVPVHPAAHGFVAGRSALTHARQHLGARVVVSVDLRDFFATVPAARLYGIVHGAGYPEPVARVLTALCTTRTPAWVLPTMPAGGADDARAVLRARLRAAHLPQGAPTSPTAANLVCFALDRRLTGWAATFGAVYSRYADDLTFSGEAALQLAVPAFLRGVTRIVADEGFRVHPGKTRVQHRDHRQLVTGIVVNERPNPTRQHHDRLRAVLHEACTRGPEVANREQVADFRSHLQGRVAWVESLNRSRGARLRAELDRVVWPEG